MRLAESRTPPIDGDTSIASMETTYLNGAAHWILVRGKSAAATPLVFVHGGPGTSEWASVRTLLSDLERDFIVVNYDQRGVGRSYLPRRDFNTLTVSQHVADLAALIQLVRQRLGARRVLVAGHSWGTVVGALYAATHPEHVLGYLSIAQVTHAQLSERREFDSTRAAALKDRNHRAVAQLDRIGPPPHDARQEAILFKWTTWYGGTFYGRRRWWPPVIKCALTAPESTLTDLLRARRGAAVARHMMPVFDDLDLRPLAPTYAVPVFFAVGRHDRLVDPVLSADYFAELDAPLKKLRWFERSAHAIPFDEPAEFIGFTRQCRDEAVQHWIQREREPA